MKNARIPWDLERLILKFESPLPHIFKKERKKREREHGEKFESRILIKLFKGAFASKAIMELEERLRLVSRWISWRNLDLSVLVVWPVMWVMCFKVHHVLVLIFRFVKIIEIYLESS